MEKETTEITGGISDMFRPLSEWTETRMVEEATGIPASVFADMFMKGVNAFDEYGCNKHTSVADNCVALKEALRNLYAPGMGRDEAFALGVALGVAHSAVTRMDFE